MLVDGGVRIPSPQLLLGEARCLVGFATGRRWRFGG